MKFLIFSKNPKIQILNIWGKSDSGEAEPLLLTLHYTDMTMPMPISSGSLQKLYIMAIGQWIKTNTCISNKVNHPTRATCFGTFFLKKRNGPFQGHQYFHQKIFKPLCNLRDLLSVGMYIHIYCRVEILPLIRGFQCFFSKIVL